MALWHVVHDDGDEEDLDRDELEAALELAAQQPEAHRERGCVAARLAAMACSRAMPAKVEPVEQEGRDGKRDIGAASSVCVCLHIFDASCIVVFAS